MTPFYLGFQDFRPGSRAPFPQPGGERQDHPAGTHPPEARTPAQSKDRTQVNIYIYADTYCLSLQVCMDTDIENNRQEMSML